MEYFTGVPKQCSVGWRMGHPTVIPGVVSLMNGAYVYLRLSLHYIAYTNLARTIGSYEMLLRSKALPRWYDLEAYRVVVLARVLPGRGDLDS